MHILTKKQQGSLLIVFVFLCSYFNRLKEQKFANANFCCSVGVILSTSTELVELEDRGQQDR